MEGGKDDEDCDSPAELLAREVVKTEVLAGIDSTQSCLFCCVSKGGKVMRYSGQ